MRLYLLSILFLFTSVSVYSQYKIAKIAYTNDPMVEAYYQDKEKKIQWTGMMRSMYETEMKKKPFHLELKNDTLLVYHVDESPRRARKLAKIGPDLYQSSDRRSFMRFDMSGDAPIMINGQYTRLKQPEEVTKEFKKLAAKYGDKVETHVTTVHFKKMDAEELASALKIKKAFKVTGVELLVNEDVMDFAEKYREHFMGFEKSSEESIINSYLNKQFLLKINYNSAKISSYQMSNGRYSYSGTVEETDDNVYRVKLMKSFWDFHTSGNKDDVFDVEKLEYITYITLKEEDKDKPEYEALKAKYGDHLPYNTIVQKVEEIPLDADD
ncbi:MAG: hypothetical protein R3345_06125 [Fulvivirga sp.]|nr:hypothetical protein [Fulvivirga sp.]